MKDISPTKLAKEFDRDDLRELVNLYVNAKAFAEVTRAKVDPIYNGLLKKYPLYEDKRFGRFPGNKTRITHHNHAYLSEDEATYQAYDKACQEAVKAAGLTDGLAEGHCPALVAENQLSNVKHLIADIVCPIMGINKDNLFCQGDGVKTWDHFIDITVKAVVASPKFKFKPFA